MNEMNRALWESAMEFTVALPDPDPIATFLDIIEAQVIEAREHLDAGNDDKALNEVADCIAVAFEALLRNGKDPERFTTERIRSRILPRIPELVRKYHTTPRFGSRELDIVLVPAKRGRKRVKLYGTYCEDKVRVRLAPHYAQVRKFVGDDVPDYILAREVSATIVHESLHAAFDGEECGTSIEEHRMIARLLDWTGFGYQG